MNEDDLGNGKYGMVNMLQYGGVFHTVDFIRYIRITYKIMSGQQSYWNG